MLPSGSGREAKRSFCLSVRGGGGTIAGSISNQTIITALFYLFFAFAGKIAEVASLAFSMKLLPDLRDSHIVLLITVANKTKGGTEPNPGAKRMKGRALTGWIRQVVTGHSSEPLNMTALVQGWTIEYKTLSLFSLLNNCFRLFNH